VPKKHLPYPDDFLSADCTAENRNYLLTVVFPKVRTFGTIFAKWKAVKAVRQKIMESGSSEIRELCKAVSQEEDSERMKVLLDELLRVLDERELVASLL